MSTADRWWEPRDLVTVADVLETGACYDGVVKWVEQHGGRIAGDPSTRRSNEYIQRAARYGTGYGDRYGSGYYGNGFGDGFGYYGFGDGFGDGFGYYGYGFGDGFGDGYSGYGDGDGLSRIA